LSAALAVPIVRLLYERGAFGPSETDVVAAALAAFSAGLAMNGAMLMLNRAFFSLQSPWVPTLIALANLALNVALNAALYRVGVWGIPLATSIVNLAGTVALAIVFRRRIGPLDGITLASALAAGLAFGTWFGLDDVLGRTLGAQVGSMGVALAVGGGVYLGLVRLLHVQELDVLLSLVRRSGKTAE
jgi:putative peptidoglycan lipid II flippase